MTSTATLAHHLPDRTLPLLGETVGDVLRRTAARFPDRPALAWADGEDVGQLTYAELLAKAGQVAVWLLERAQPGDRIGIWSRNSVEWILLEYGCALAGMVVCGWNPAWTDFECEHAFNLTTPALLLAGCDTRGHPLMDRAQTLGEAGRVFALEDLQSLVRDAAPRPLARVTDSDLFLIQFTSGTTGRSKGSALSHRAALNSARFRVWTMEGDETDISVNPSPLNHVGGGVSLVLSAVLSGSCYVVMSRFDAAEQLRLMQLFGATRIGGVPTVMLAILDHPNWTPGSVRIRAVGCGGAQVPRPLIDRLLREFDAPMLTVYGQSECPAISATALADPPDRLAETVGRPLPHTELKITDLQTGKIVRRGEVGEICVRSPIVMEGYFANPDATASTIDADGFLHTGDLGSLDAEGYLRIHGRAREVIIRGGENIYPAEVEDALLQHPDVSAVAVVGVPDDRWGQIVGAAVIAREGRVPKAEDLEAHAGTRLAHFKVPRRWLVVESLPLTPSGKIRKVEVEKLFLG
jgi:fatty-acyl-CoA synthase